jgi:hypothetical protein
MTAVCLQCDNIRMMKHLRGCRQDSTAAVKHQEKSLQQKRGAKQTKTAVEAADSKQVKQVCRTHVEVYM